MTEPDGTSEQAKDSEPDKDAPTEPDGTEREPEKPKEEKPPNKAATGHGGQKETETITKRKRGKQGPNTGQRAKSHPNNTTKIKKKHETTKQKQTKEEKKHDKQPNKTRQTTEKHDKQPNKIRQKRKKSHILHTQRKTSRKAQTANRRKAQKKERR